jgi:hypothetical protein
LNKVVPLVAPEAAPKEVKLLPGSVYGRYPVDVRYSRTFVDLVRRGAPQTDGATIEDFDKRCASFSKFATVSGMTQVLLVLLGEFIMARKFDRWVAEQGLVPVDWPTLLTVSEAHPKLVCAVKQKRVRLVSLAHVFAYNGESHVCTVHQEDNPTIVRRVMKYEPVKSGWGREHLFAFKA